MIKEKISEILSYFLSTRQVGHTETMMKGALSNPDSVIVIAVAEDGNQLKRTYGAKNSTVYLGNLNGLKGKKTPLVFDNFALVTLFDDVLVEFRRLESQLHKATTTIKHSEGIVAKMANDMVGVHERLHLSENVVVELKRQIVEKNLEIKINAIKHMLLVKLLILIIIIIVLFL